MTEKMKFKISDTNKSEVVTELRLASDGEGGVDVVARQGVNEVVILMIQTDGTIQRPKSPGAYKAFGFEVDLDGRVKDTAKG